MRDYHGKKQAGKKAEKYLGKIDKGIAYLPSPIKMPIKLIRKAAVPLAEAAGSSVAHKLDVGNQMEQILPNVAVTSQSFLFFLKIFSMYIQYDNKVVAKHLVAQSKDFKPVPTYKKHSPSPTKYYYIRFLE